MTLYPANPEPSFNITRASHVVLTSQDLDATRYFYETAIGLEVTHQDSETLAGPLHVRGRVQAHCMRRNARRHRPDKFNPAGELAIRGRAARHHRLALRPATAGHAPSPGSGLSTPPGDGEKC